MNNMEWEYSTEILTGQNVTPHPHIFVRDLSCMEWDLLSISSNQVSAIHFFLRLILLFLGTGGKIKPLPRYALFASCIGLMLFLTTIMHSYYKHPFRLWMVSA